jgi:probable HAF family extracellular repeat protein
MRMRKPTQHRRSRRSPRPLHLLALEDRCLLSAYTVTDLGTLGGLSSSAEAINAAGQVVGESRTADDHLRAFLYSDGVMTDIGISLDTNDSLARGINDLGQVVGSFAPPGVFDEFSHAFVYDSQTGVMTDLGTFGRDKSDAFGINNQGTVVGGYCDRFCSPANTQTHAFSYSLPDGVFADLGTLGGTWSWAYGINNEGDIVGVAADAAHFDSPHPFLYRDGAMMDLQTLEGAGYGYGLNDVGQAVGFSTTRTGTHAFLWDPSTQMQQDLGTLSGQAFATGVNNAGQVVGYYTDEQLGPDHAFIYSDGTMTDLNTLIPPGSGFLGHATGINDAGQIVGIGFGFGGNNSRHAFLLTPDPGNSPRGGVGPEVLRLLVPAPETGRAVEVAMQLPTAAVPERAAADTIASAATDATVRRATDPVFAGSHRSRPTGQADGWEADLLTENRMTNSGENPLAVDMRGW